MNQTPATSLLNHTPPAAHLPQPTTHADRFAETRRLQALWITATRMWIVYPSPETQQRRQEAHEVYANEQAIALGIAQVVQQMNRQPS